MTMEIVHLKPLVISTRRPLLLQQTTLYLVHNVKKGTIKHKNTFFKDEEEYLSFLFKMGSKGYLVYDHLPLIFHKRAIKEGLQFATMTLPRRTNEGNLVSITVFKGEEKTQIEKTIPYNKIDKERRRKFASW